MMSIWKSMGIWLSMLIAVTIITLSLIQANDRQFYGASITSYDIKEKLAYVELDERLTIGTDGACQAAGEIIATIIEVLGKGWRVFITNEWVPSAKNPIDAEWAETLRSGYGSEDKEKVNTN